MSVHLWVQVSKPKVHSISDIWRCGQMINRFDIHIHLISETKHSSPYRSGFPGGSVVKNPLANAGNAFDVWVWKIPWRRKLQSITVFLPGKSHGQRKLMEHCPWDCKESEKT